MENKKIIWLASAIVLSLTINGLLVGRALQRFSKENRTISVKGFSEREVKADLAVWTIHTGIAANDLTAGAEAIDEIKNKVIAYLHENGFTPEEISQKDFKVLDKKAQEYEGNNPPTYRFILSNVIQIRTRQVDAIDKISRKTDELLKRGVMVSSGNDYQGGVSYYYTKLSEIKPEMLTDATQNARKAAQQFATESNSKIGKLKRASQGLFTIIDRDESLGSQPEESYASGTNDLFKKVRVVVSVEYSIE